MSSRTKGTLLGLYRSQLSATELLTSRQQGGRVGALRKRLRNGDWASVQATAQHYLAGEQQASWRTFEYRATHEMQQLPPLESLQRGRPKSGGLVSEPCASVLPEWTGLLCKAWRGTPSLEKACIGGTPGTTRPRKCTGPSDELTLADRTAQLSQAPAIIFVECRGPCRTPLPGIVGLVRNQ